jgi:hypothetical protein
MAGLLTCSLFPPSRCQNSGNEVWKKNKKSELTVAGTVPDFHRSSLIKAVSLSAYKPPLTMYKGRSIFFKYKENE